MNQNLGEITRSLNHFWPEVSLCFLIIVLVVLTIVRPGPPVTRIISILGVIVYFILLDKFGPSASIFGGMLTMTPLYSLRYLTAIVTLITFLIANEQEKEEFFLLIAAILLGADLLIISNHLLITLLSMELMSLSSYVLVAGFSRDKGRAEAGWKFFLYGSVVTALMIFGMSYIFGTTGTLYMEKAAETTDKMSVMLLIGSMMTMAGFFFKTTAAPFHIWAPDVYESAPVSVISFLSVVPKIAGVAALAHFGYNYNFTFPSIGLFDIMVVVSVLSIIVGTLAALSQTKVKRMMAYSSVAQAGFLVLAASLAGPRVFAHYAIVFAAMNYVVFIVIQQLEKSIPSPSFSDFSGLGKTHPFLAISVTIGLISLIGLPPIAGFMIKLEVFTGVWKSYSETGDNIALVAFIVGLLATVAALFFYLKIPFFLYFRQPSESLPIKTPLLTNLLLAILVSLLLVLFFASGG